MTLIRLLAISVIVLIQLVHNMANAANSGSVFEKYDFSEGGYSIVGHKTNMNSANIELKDFVIEDVKSLNLIKNQFSFGKRVPPNACGYHYYIHILKEGETLEKLAFNIDDSCSTVSTQQGTFQFNKNDLTSTYDLADNIELKKHRFKTLQDARDFLTDIKRDSNVVLIKSVPWNEFDGTFRVSVNCESHNYKKIKIDSCINKLAKKLKRLEPDLNFSLMKSGSSKNRILILCCPLSRK